MQLLNEGRRWVMPGPEYAGTIAFYEDFPYAYWNESALDQLGADSLVGLNEDVSIFPTYADIGDQLEKKITGIRIYESQMERLFDDTKSMADAVRKYAKILAELGDIDGAAERYWVTSRV